MPRPILLEHPMSAGVVTDWDDMEELWRHGIEDVMGLEAVEHPVLMADSTATPAGERCVLAFVVALCVCVCLLGEFLGASLCMV